MKKEYILKLILIDFYLTLFSFLQQFLYIDEQDGLKHTKNYKVNPA